MQKRKINELKDDIRDRKGNAWLKRNNSLVGVSRIKRYDKPRTAMVD